MPNVTKTKTETNTEFPIIAMRGQRLDGGREDGGEGAGHADLICQLSIFMQKWNAIGHCHFLDSLNDIAIAEIKAIFFISYLECHQDEIILGSQDCGC